ncbi:Hypothetical protein FKW44_009990 [Caligus rogercresseyi]|uniref:Uncharacterized protein n=1 Tax=Caligus rogercresseyi TaxID=217165 RepID=A0A7T8HFY5_CALRO|nr:Hypothetical protein FKW44_009990 [Caligus rogercresseyi]
MLIQRLTQMPGIVAKIEFESKSGSKVRDASWMEPNTCPAIYFPPKLTGQS